MAIDYVAPHGQVRLLAGDVDESNLLLTDEQVGGFLLVEGGNVRLAAAQALDTIATSEALVSKKIRTQDLQTDGPAVAAELRARAALLRQQVADGYDADSLGAFAVIPARTYPPELGELAPWSADWYWL